MFQQTGIGHAFYDFSKEEPEYYKTIALYEMAQMEATAEGEPPQETGAPSNTPEEPPGLRVREVP